jgi:DNA-binding NtrC family response regulator
VDSEENQGTTFNIYLPVSDKSVAEKPEDESKTISGKGTILFVDDETMILDVGKPMLEKLGYNIHIATNGNKAIEIFKEKWKELDLVILDMIMPDIGGGEVFDKMKEINPNARVLLSSGYSIDGQAAEIMNRGCTGFIQKPFTLRQLSEKIHEIIYQDMKNDTGKS